MADTVNTTVLESTKRRYIVQLTCVSDGTGETGVVKVDKSALVASNGLEPRSLIVDHIAWSIQGFTSIRLYWDHTTDDEIDVLASDTSASERSYWDVGGLNDPETAGGTGDIILTSAGASAGDTYSLVLNCRLKPTA